MPVFLSAVAVLVLSAVECGGAELPLTPAQAWIPQDTVMYVPDPDLPSMGQGDMAPGSTVFAYVRNTSSSPMRMEGMTWNGKPVAELASAPPYDAVWWRLNPETVPPGGVGEICFRLRTRIADKGLLSVTFSNGLKLALNVHSSKLAFRIQTLTVAEDLKHVYIYVEKEGQGPPPAYVLMDGSSFDGKVIWLSQGYIGALRVAMIEMRQPLLQGAWHTWTVKSAAAQASTTVRVIAEPVAMGLSGASDFRRLSTNGFTACHVFHFPGIETLQAAAASRVRLNAQASPSKITPEHQSHPGIMGYNVFDEPDCNDDTAGNSQGRPWGLRVGMSAPEMVGLVQAAASAAPRLPIFMTLNMTFIPGNYYTYGAIPDIMTPDFYPITHARSVGQIRTAAAHAKRATAPRPLGFIYQCNWEEWAVDISGSPYNGWAGRDAINEKGPDFFRDGKRTRGFGRPPAGDEVELQIAYLLGEGVKYFWGYGDSTECCQGLLFHGAVDLPGVWASLVKMAKILSHIRNELGISHPFSWTESGQARVLARTLLCGRDRALVIAINEDYQSAKKGFSRKAAGETLFTFPDLPWLRACKVEIVTPDGFLPCQTSRAVGATTWKIPSLETTAIFRISGAER